tara:strand:+ start:1008 stop:1640 length:633 start_codon:yes stop_codon:yes gene_type:complete
MHIIHRGKVNKKSKENTLKSFKASFCKGYGIETDIHATKDNQFICFHDFTLKRIYRNNCSVKNLNYSQIKNITKNNEIPLLKDLLKLSKNKFYLFIEIKPLFSNKLIKKLLFETRKFKKCIFISFKDQNIIKILKINKKIKVGLSYSPTTSMKKIIKKSKNKYINCIILDKFFLQKTKIQELNKNKFFYTIKNKQEFKKFSKNNLIFENL